MQDERRRSANQWTLWIGIAVMTALAILMANWLAFAGWMTAYYNEPRLIQLWQVRFYWRLAGLVLLGAADLYLVIRAVRNRRDNRTQ